MYTPEQKFEKNLVDLVAMTIPPKYFGNKAQKLTEYYYDRIEPGYYTPYDPYDPHIIASIMDWVKGPEVNRLQVGLGSFTGSTGCTVTHTNGSHPDTIDLKIVIDQDVNNVHISGSPSSLTEDRWYIQEFWAEIPRDEIIIASDTGNFAIDIAGGIETNSGEDRRYNNANGNYPSLLCQRFINDTAGGITVDEFRITIRNVKEGDVIYLKNLWLAEITPA